MRSKINLMILLRHKKIVMCCGVDSKQSLHITKN
jgi:hypothetical protein